MLSPVCLFSWPLASSLFCEICYRSLLASRRRLTLTGGSFLYQVPKPPRWSNSPSAYSSQQRILPFRGPRHGIGHATLICPTHRDQTLFCLTATSLLEGLRRCATSILLQMGSPTGVLSKACLCRSQICTMTPHVLAVPQTLTLLHVKRLSR